MYIVASDNVSDSEPCGNLWPAVRSKPLFAARFQTHSMTAKAALQERKGWTVAGTWRGRGRRPRACKRLRQPEDCFNVPGLAAALANHWFLYNRREEGKPRSLQLARALPNH